MKRELKALDFAALMAAKKGFRRCPYEEGTESIHTGTFPGHVPTSFRRCPYEEGTESGQAP